MKTNALIGAVLLASIPSAAVAQLIPADKLADPTFVSVQVAALGKPWVTRLRQRMPVHSWTSCTGEDAAKIRAYADAAIWESDGRP